MMQFAVYQLKDIPENRSRRFRPYHVLQEQGVRVQSSDYEQAYFGRMQPGDTPEAIRSRLGQKLPRNFKGHSVSVSDVFVLNTEGVVTSYYVEKDGFTVIEDFITQDNSASGSAVTIDTAGFHIEGKEGSWLAFDSAMIEGKQFFLMEHEKYGKEAAWVVVDGDGKLVADNVYDGLDGKTLQRIRDYLNPPPPVKEPVKQGRPSVLAKLHRKQAEIARRSAKAVPQVENTERRRQ